MLPWLLDPERGNYLGMWRHVHLVPLAPDLTLPRRYTEKHGLVTAAEIGAMFCVSEDRVKEWVQDPYFPPVRGRLVDEDSHRHARLYLLSEVRQYLVWAVPELDYLVLDG